MRFFSLIALWLLPNCVFGEDKILVTATRSGAQASQLPFTIGNVGGSEWDANGGIPETALGSIPGLSFSTNGGPGQSRSLRIRGANAEHTLVLIDGIPVNDPLSPSRSFDFGHIPLAELDRVEVLKGPQSVLYGSDALGGVVQIFTKQDEQIRAKLEGGSQRTLNTRLAAMGFRAGYSESKGFSSADEREGNSEPDGYRQWNLGGSKKFALNNSFLMQANAQYQENKTDTDRNGGPGGDSLGTFSRHSIFLFSEENTWLLPADAELKLGGSFNAHDREDNTNGSDFFKAERWKVESLLRQPNLLGTHSLSLGGEYGEETGRSSQISAGKRSFRQGGIFLQDQLGWGAFQAVAGARVDFHSEHENAQTFRLGMGYWLQPERLRIKYSIGTGFKAPSLYQTYSVYGSRNLRPERSLGSDLGLELKEGDWSTELTFFANRFRDLIDFNLQSNRYFNQGRAETYGVEWGTEYRFGRLRVSNAFTMLRAVNPENGQQLLRRPRLSNNLQLSYERARKVGGSLSLRYIGIREDTHAVLLTRQTLPAFVTLGAHFFRSLGEGLRFTARGENILNRRYQETSGYGVPPLSGYAGIEADL